MEQKVNRIALPGVFATLGIAVKQTVINPTFLGLLLAFSLVAATLMYLGGPMNPDELTNPALFFAGLGLYIIGGMFLAGPLVVYSLAAAQNRQRSTRELLGAVRYSLPVIITNILATLAIVFGLLLLIVPGVILIARLVFPTYIVADKDIGPLKALKESFRITKGHVLVLLKFFIVLMLIAVLVGLVFGLVPIIGQIMSSFMALVTSIVVAHLYLAFTGQTPDRKVVPDPAVSAAPAA